MPVFSCLIWKLSQRSPFFCMLCGIGIFYKEVGGFEDSLVTHELGAFPVCLVASPNTAQRFRDFSTPKRKLQIPLIINEPNCIFRQIFERYLRNHAIILDHTIELSSIATIKNLVQNDVGISFLPRYTVEQELLSGHLVEIETKIEETEITAVCAYHKNKWISPLIRLFLQEVNQMAEETSQQPSKHDIGKPTPGFA